MILAPSILAADFGILAEQIKEVENAGVNWLHIDVMDGHFVPNISFAMPVIKSIRKYTDLFFDVHLMIENPEKYIDRFIDSGADGITFHIEAAKDVQKCIDMIHARNKRACIAINPETPLDTVYKYLDKVEMILIMTVHPGYGGQEYITEMNDKIQKLRARVGADFNIQVDGGINEENIHIAEKYGANVIVAGTAVFNSDISGSIERLTHR